MTVTQIRSEQVFDEGVKRADLNSTTVVSAVIKKVVQGSGITLSSTGADTGTGDVTISGSTSADWNPVSFMLMGS